MTEADTYIVVLPTITVRRDEHPLLFDRLTRLSHRPGQIAGLVIHALERDLLADTQDRDYTLATILSEVQAIRATLEGEQAPEADLPSSVSDALANLGKGHS